ncbi:MAG: T9SS type A sorting domain-containing protein [Candidatus Krumholzibacteriota bacterium]|nr:T9SS type A sorting domain-containing protein [Candidatus Krumholzibacteriota bacterium]
MTKQSRLAARSLAWLALLAALLLALLGDPAAAEERIGFAGGSEAVIYSAPEVMERYVTVSGETAWLRLPGHAPEELLRPEGGEFVPHQVHDVVAALLAVSCTRPVGEVAIYVLPWPRRSITSSSAGGHTIYLSPGVRAIPAEVTHMVTTHELGHVFHNTRLPDANQALWDRFRALRGIEDESVYHEGAIHRNRPHEILAEDFRFLFGGSLANYSGTIENSDLLPPDQVRGLREFLCALATTPAVAGLTAANYPNPFNPATRLTIVAEAGMLGSPMAVQVFDTRGRLVRSLYAGRCESVTTRLTWDGRDEAGVALSSGVYFARVAVGDARHTHKMILVE